MKELTYKQKAKAFDLLISGNFNPIFSVYNKLKDTEEQENWCQIIIKQACEDALRIVAYQTGL